MAGPESLTSGRRVGREQASTRALAPLTLCVGAGFVSAFAPVLVWRLETGDWVCIKDWDTSYYLRFVAQAYCHRALNISDVVVPGVPAVYAARVLDAGPFAVELIWIFLSAIGLSAG